LGGLVLGQQRALVRIRERLKIASRHPRPVGQAGAGSAPAVGDRWSRDRRAGRVRALGKGPKCHSSLPPCCVHLGCGATLWLAALRSSLTVRLWLLIW